MEWESNADRTNAVAAALTVVLRNHFPGGKPIFCVTANKSHAGKDTVIAFATGDAGSVSVSYQQTNWALERSVVGVLKTNPDTAVVVVENARLAPEGTVYRVGLPGEDRHRPGTVPVFHGDGRRRCGGRTTWCWPSRPISGRSARTA